ncbi:hypothetical protein DFS34DRAFT_611053, partial [Phlyctochytrium arcticum]
MGTPDERRGVLIEILNGIFEEEITWDQATSDDNGTLLRFVEGKLSIDDPNERKKRALILTALESVVATYGLEEHDPPREHIRQICRKVSRNTIEYLATSFAPPHPAPPPVQPPPAQPQPPPPAQPLQEKMEIEEDEPPRPRLQPFDFFLKKLCVLKDAEGNIDVRRMYTPHAADQVYSPHINTINNNPTDLLKVLIRCSGNMADRRFQQHAAYVHLGRIFKNLPRDAFLRHIQEARIAILQQNELSVASVNSFFKASDIKNLKSRFGNAFLLYKEFGPGILTAIPLISDTKGSIYSKMTRPQRKLAARYFRENNIDMWWHVNNRVVEESISLHVPDQPQFFEALL